MGSANFLSGWDTTILMVPFLGILVMYMFHLDERFAAPKGTPKSRRFFCGVDPKGRAQVSDPDGHPWRQQGAFEIEGRLEPMARSEGRDSVCQVRSRDLGLARKTDSMLNI